MPKFLLTVLTAALLATQAAAGPNPQLVTSVQTGLAQYGLHPDVSQFATSTVVRLHMTLSSTEDLYDTRAKLIAILRNPKLK